MNGAGLARGRLFFELRYFRADEKAKAAELAEAKARAGKRVQHRPLRRLLVWQDDRVKLRSKLCIFDSDLIANSSIYPMLDCGVEDYRRSDFVTFTLDRKMAAVVDARML